MSQSARTTAAALSHPLKRAARLARDLQTEAARVADGLQGELVASVEVRNPADADAVADLIRSEVGRWPLSVLISRPTTAPPEGTQED
jgi:hypothetical protein